MAGTSCELVDITSKIEQPESKFKDQIQSGSRKELFTTSPEPVTSEYCKNKNCLLGDTPRVGVFPLKPKSLEDSLIGKGDQGQTFKFGKGKVTQGNVNAARNLLSREFPQVIIFKLWYFKSLPTAIVD